MKERLLGLVFLGALLSVALDFLFDKLHAKLLPDSLWFQDYWYIPYVAVPLAVLVTLAFSLGFFRPKGPRGADALALLTMALLLYLTVGANHACWKWCF
jgi:hypothetical protein